jgi:poly-gamma-glutamate capsule biosynthesis protein CapA/YwtB (metallophosphatase superfamily)
MAAEKSVSASDGIKPQEPVKVQQQPDPSITIVMVGDVLLHTAVNESGEMEDGTYNYKHLFKNVRADIEDADLAIANQEVILGGTELGLSGYPAFNGAFEVGDALCDAGFDVVLHATNHALDKGKKGLLNCLRYWETNHPEMSALGIYESAEAHEKDLFLYEKDDIKIAILNYTYGTNGIALPADMPFAVNLLDKDQIKEDVMKAEEKADFIIVCPHWGTEYNLGISKQQEEYAKLFADLGVDLVIGTHPHVIEPISWIESTVPKDATQEEPHKMLVYYSIGNYINATSRTGDGVAAQAVGAMAKVTISKDKK